MKNFEMKTASAISAALHAAVLLWALISFSGKTFEVTPAESMPIDLVSVDEFSKLTKGVKDAPKIETPKPAAEKKDELKPVEEMKPKVVEKKEVEATKTESLPPPEERKPEPKPEAKPQEKPEPKTDPIAEKLKKQDEPKKEAKAEEKPLPHKKPPPPKPQPKFDPDKIAALLDKREPTRQALAGDAPNEMPTLGAAKGNAAQLSQSEIDALRARLRQCWNPPVGAADAQKLFVVFRVLFKKDGSIMRDPVLVEGAASSFGPALAESAKRALLQCQPYRMLKPEHYDTWKDMEITFDPRDMLRG